MQLKLETIKIWGFDMQRINVTQKIVNTVIEKRSIPLLFQNRILHRLSRYYC